MFVDRLVEDVVEEVEELFDGLFGVDIFTDGDFPGGCTAIVVPYLPTETLTSQVE